MALDDNPRAWQGTGDIVQGPPQAGGRSFAVRLE